MSLSRNPRDVLGALQRRTLQALVAGPQAEAKWVDAHLPGAHPAILEQGIRGVHRSNVESSMSFYFPRFASEAQVSDWHDVCADHPTTGGHARLMDHWFGIAWSLTESLSNPAAFRDLLRIEAAHFRVQELSALDRPALVAAVRSVVDLDWDARGIIDTDFGRFVRLETTYFDTHWISGNRVVDAVRFGPPRSVLFYAVGGEVRNTVFSSLDQLAVTLCFG